MYQKIWLFPVCVTILVPLSFIITYIIAVKFRHVDPVFPYISDTGTIPPESCVFGQLMNMSALLIAVCMYLRHRQVVEFHRKAVSENVRLLRSSTGLIWMGYLSTFGISMVANFQETSWFSVHLLGANMAFGFGLVYIWGQTILGRCMRKPLSSTPYLIQIRFLLCILTTIFYLIMAVTLTILLQTATPPFRLKPRDEGYAILLASTASEWVMVTCFTFYFVTFAFELRNAMWKPPKLLLDFDEAQLPHDRSMFGPSLKSAKSARSKISVKSSRVKSVRGGKSVKALKIANEGQSPKSFGPSKNAKTQKI